MSHMYAVIQETGETAPVSWKVFEYSLGIEVGDISWDKELKRCVFVPNFPMPVAAFKEVVSIMDKIDREGQKE